MVTKHKIKLDIEGFDKIVAAPKWLDKLTSSQKNYKKALEQTNAENNKLIKLLKAQEGNTASVWLTQKKMNLQMLGAKLANPMPILIEGAKMFGAALKGLGIGLLLSALTAISAIGKKAFDFNIGGLKTGFLEVMGKITRTLADIQMRFLKLVKTLDPVLKPLTDFLVGTIITGIDNIMKFADSLGAALGGAEGVKDIVGELVNSFMLLFNTLQGVFKSISEGFGGESSVIKWISNLIKSTFKFINAIAKLTASIINLLNKFGLFKAIGGLMKGVMVILNGIVEAITAIVDGLTKMFDFIAEQSEKHPIIAKMFGFQNSNAKPINTTNNNSIANNYNNNANLTVNTNNFNANNAKQVMELMSNRMFQSSNVGY